MSTVALPAAAGRVARRAGMPAAASSCAAAVVSTAAALFASRALTTTVPGRQQLPLTVEDVIMCAGEVGALRLSGPLADVRGRWGVVLEHGYAVTESVGGRGGRTVRLVHGRIAAGDRARLDAHLYHGDHLPRGLTPAVVTVDGPAGGCVAWRFDGGPAAATTWAVFVHGRGAGLTQGLRVVPTLRAAGLTTLIPSYRGDDGAPPASRSGLGSHEWRDLEAAVRYAAAHGAERVVLIGYSMGAALITAFLRRSALADTVAGVVLDSPVLDWGAVLRHVARSRRLPAALVPATMTVSALRARIDWRLLDALRGDHVHRPPVLLFHGTGDALVPSSLSDALAAAWPDTVTYHRVDGAPHVAAYNVDPRRYEWALQGFLARLGATGRPRAEGDATAYAPITRAN